MRVEGSGWFAASLLFASLTLSATLSDEAVIVFNSQTVTKPSLVVNQCTSERPYYELRRGQLLTLHLMSDISLTDDKTHGCQMINEGGTIFQSPTMYRSPVIVYRDHILNSTKYVSKVLLGSVGDTGYLMCYFTYKYIYRAASVDQRQFFIACTTFIRLADTSLGDPVIQYVFHTIQVTIKEFGNVTEELQFNDTSSILLNFAMPDQENCTYTIIRNVAEFISTPNTIKYNNLSAVNNESLLAEQEECTYKVISRENKTILCNNDVAKNQGFIVFHKLSMFDDNDFIGLIEKNKYTNTSRETGIKLIYIDTGIIDYENLIIRFNIDTKVTPSVVITKCVSELPLYAVYRRQNITIEIMSDTSVVEILNNCTIGDIQEDYYHFLSEYDKKLQTEEKYSNYTIFKTKLFLSNVGVESGYIICPLLINKKDIEYSSHPDKLNRYIDWITCMARITIVDGRQFENDYQLPYISAKIHVSIKDFSNETEEIEFYENSSLNVMFDNLSEQEDCAYTIHWKDLIVGNFSNNSEVTKETGFFLNTLDLHNDWNEFYIEEQNLQTHKTRRAAVRLFYRGVYNYTTLYRKIEAVVNEEEQSSWWVALEAGAALAVLAALAGGVAIYWRRAVKISRAAAACTGDIARARAAHPGADGEDSGDYENVYDYVYENRMKLAGLRSMRAKETLSPLTSPPSPPPLDSMPRRVQESSHLPSVPVAPAPPRPGLPPDSLIPARDLYLLNIDSEGYEIPVI